MDFPGKHPVICLSAEAIETFLGVLDTSEWEVVYELP
jgi:hypothetical protein